jgi:hypothetical protein
MQPINYTIETDNPYNKFMQGYSQGIVMQDALEQRQAQKLQQEKQMQMEQQMQTDLSALVNGTPTAKDYSNLILKYPQISERVKKSWDVMAPELQQNKLSHYSQIYSALENDEPEIAKAILKRQSEAYRNTGLDNDAQKEDDLIKLIDLNPKGAKLTGALMLSSILGPEKFEQTVGRLLGEKRSEQLQPAVLQKQQAEADIKSLEAGNAPDRFALENRDVESKIVERAQRLGLDKDKLTLDYRQSLAKLNPATNLSDSAIKIINDSASESALLNESATQKLDLANRIETELFNHGALTRGWEAIKSLTGTEDAESNIRREYTRVRNSEAIRNLPPGPATDPDIKMALAPLPESSANAKTLASFLRGLSKLQQFEAKYNDAKSQWVNEVGYLGKAKQDVEIEGIKVAAGGNFPAFAKQYMGNIKKQEKKQENQQQVKSRSYMVFAQ